MKVSTPHKEPCNWLINFGNPTANKFKSIRAAAFPRARASPVLFQKRLQWEVFDMQTDLPMARVTQPYPHLGRLAPQFRVKLYASLTSACSMAAVHLHIRICQARGRLILLPPAAAFNQDHKAGPITRAQNQCYKASN